jgi:hypothetical protein
VFRPLKNNPALIGAGPRFIFEVADIVVIACLSAAKEDWRRLKAILLVMRQYSPYGTAELQASDLYS